MKVYIVDDEDHARENLRRKIDKLERNVSYCGEASSVQEAYEALIDLDIDLLFLDIEMPEEDGFDLLERFDTLPFKVIFVTAYNEFALKAFEYYAIGYVTKPIDNETLHRAIERANGLVDLEEGKIRAAIDTVKNKDVVKVIIPNSTGYTIVPVDEVIQFVSEEGYTRVYTAEGKKLISTRRLKDYEEILQDSGFLRVHRSRLINCQHILEYNRDGTILLTNDLSIVINKNNRKTVSKMIKTYFDEK